MPGAVTIAQRDERRARWVLDTLGVGHLRPGADLPYRPEAWAAADRGERPAGDALAEAFFHLARIEERAAPRDEHGRFLAVSSCLDPLDPPLDRLRRELGVDPPRYRDARFAVALTHDVGGANPDGHVAELLTREREYGARSTFFVMAGDGHTADGAAPEPGEQLHPGLVEALAASGVEIGLHGSYLAAADLDLLARERALLAQLDGPLIGHRYERLRLDPHRNLASLTRLGFRYDSTLGFPDALGFRAGIAHPFRPWDPTRERPADLIEVPLAVVDATLGGEGDEVPPMAAKPRLLALLDWAAEHGGGFAILWAPERFGVASGDGWDRLYVELIEAVHERGGVCLSAGELAGLASERLELPRD
jgi:peptidoglycan/xylan/chitin deacetylase (PgdA/CDA1 family)